MKTEIQRIFETFSDDELDLYCALYETMPNGVSLSRARMISCRDREREARTREQYTDARVASRKRAKDVSESIGEVAGEASRKAGEERKREAQ